MNQATIRALDAINRDFYAARAAEFSATRESPWPGWERLLEPLEALRAHSPRLRILDVGCGSGRLARWLTDRLARPHRYVGLDRSLPILALARAGLDRSAPSSAREPPTRATWIRADLLDSAGGLPCPDAAFDAVVAFGLLHHLPSFTLRRAVVADLVRLLPRGGLAAIACWQFGSDPRFAGRVLSWEHAPGVDPGQLEQGDRLLQWGEAGSGNASGAMRYCHYADPAEVDRLTAGLPVDILDTYRADGRSGELNLYRMLRRI